MSRRPLLKASVAAALCVAASLALFGGGRIGTTFALFNAETNNTGSAFAAGWLDAPTGPATTVSGADVVLSWTPAAHPPATGQQLSYVDNGPTNSNCSSVTTAPLGGALGAAVTSQTDTGRGSGASNGDWICYQVASTAGSWSTSASFAAVRVGFFATSAAVSNGATSRTLANTDSFAVTFNQPPATPSSTRLCTYASTDATRPNTILVGANSCSSPTSWAYRLVSSLGLTNSGTYTVSYTVSTNTLTATITASPGTATTIASGTPSWTLSPSSVVSATGSAAVCTASTCLPTPSGDF